MSSIRWINFIVVGIILGLMAAGVCAQDKPSVKITPKASGGKQEPSANVKPSSSKPAAAQKPAQNKPAAKPNPPSPTSPDFPPGDIIRDVMMIVDGRLVNVEELELIRGVHAMIWLRDLESLGWGTVSAEPDGTITFANSNVKLTFSKNQDTAMLNTLAVKLPIQTYVRSDRLMVPLSFVAKSMGHEYDCSYRSVAMVITESAMQSIRESEQAQASTGNTIQGRVEFNGHPIAGIKIRLVDKELIEIEGARCETGADGAYSISNLPDGEYAAYVYTGDNPEYFNRATQVTNIQGQKTFNMKPLALAKILSGVSPAGDEPVKGAGGALTATWTALDGVAEYRLSMKNENGSDVLPEMRTHEAKATIKTDSLTTGAKYVLEVNAYDSNGEYIGGTPGSGAKAWSFTYSE